MTSRGISRALATIWSQSRLREPPPETRPRVAVAPTPWTTSRQSRSAKATPSSTARVSALHYGFTRQGGESTGILNGSPVSFRGIDTIYGTSTASKRIVPVHTISEDLDWTHGSHDFKFGAIARLISNQSESSDM